MGEEARHPVRRDKDAPLGRAGGSRDEDLDGADRREQAVEHRRDQGAYGYVRAAERRVADGAGRERGPRRREGASVQTRSCDVMPACASAAPFRFTPSTRRTVPVEPPLALRVGSGVQLVGDLQLDTGVRGASPVVSAAPAFDGHRLVHHEGPAVARAGAHRGRGRRPRGRRRGSARSERAASRRPRRRTRAGRTGPRPSRGRRGRRARR